MIDRGSLSATITRLLQHDNVANLPHLFVCGPHGSGKTEIVCDIIQRLYGPNALGSDAQLMEEDFGDESHGTGSRMRVVRSPFHTEYVCQESTAAVADRHLIASIQQDADSDTPLDLASFQDASNCMLYGHFASGAGGRTAAYVRKAIVIWNADHLRHGTQTKLRRIMETLSTVPHSRNEQDRQYIRSIQSDANRAAAQTNQLLFHKPQRLFVLISSHPGSIIQPLISRMLTLRVPAFSDQEMRLILQHEFPALRDECRHYESILEVAEGNATTALAMAAALNSLPGDDMQAFECLQAPWMMAVENIAGIVFLTPRPVSSTLLGQVQEVLRAKLLPNLITPRVILHHMANFLLCRVMDLGSTSSSPDRVAFLARALALIAHTESIIAKRVIASAAVDRADLHLMHLMHQLACLPQPLCLLVAAEQDEQALLSTATPTPPPPSPSPPSQVQQDMEESDKKRFPPTGSIPVPNLDDDDDDAVLKLILQSREHVAVQRRDGDRRPAEALIDKDRQELADRRRVQFLQQKFYECMVDPGDVHTNHFLSGFTSAEETPTGTWIYRM